MIKAGVDQLIQHRLFFTDRALVHKCRLHDERRREMIARLASVDVLMSGVDDGRDAGRCKSLRYYHCQVLVAAGEPHSSGRNI